MGQRGAHMLFAVCQLGHPTGDLLAQRQRRGVLQMGTADLHDVGKRLALGLQCGAQLGNGRQQLLLDGRDRCHMHGRGIDVVAGLAFVHVVIRVHQARLATLAAQQLAGAVGQHLVDVHIGLRARAGLPHHQREFARVLAGQHLIGGGVDGLGLLGIQQTQGMVHRGRCLLHLRQRGNDLARLLFAADVEVLQRTLGLGPPEPVGRNVDGAEGVFFLARGLAGGGSACHFGTP